MINDIFKLRETHLLRLQDPDCIKLFVESIFSRENK